MHPATGDIDWQASRRRPRGHSAASVCLDAIEDLLQPILITLNAIAARDLVNAKRDLLPQSFEPLVTLQRALLVRLDSYNGPVRQIDLRRDQNHTGMDDCFEGHQSPRRVDCWA